MSLAQANKLQEARGLLNAINAILQIHHAEFPPASAPLAPTPPPIDADAIRDSCLEAALKGISVFDRASRKAAKEQASRDAAARIQADTEQFKREYLEYKAQLATWWNRLATNDPDVVLYALAEAFDDNYAAAAAVGVHKSEATLVVLVPGEDAVPEKMPSTTASGNLSLKKMTKKDHDGFYSLMVAGYTLVTIKEAFAVAPGLESVRVVVVRSTGLSAYGAKKGEVVLAARFARMKLVGVQWSKVDAATILNGVADELLLNVKGVNKSLQALDLTKEPDIAAVLETISFDELSTKES